MLGLGVLGLRTRCLDGAGSNPFDQGFLGTLPAIHTFRIIMESSEISGFGALGLRRTQFGFGVATEAFIHGSRNGTGPRSGGNMPVC